MKLAMLALLAVAAACGKPAEGQSNRPAGAGPTATTTVALPTAEMLREEACACTTAECAERVQAALERERARLEETFEAGAVCLSENGLDPDVTMLLRKLEEVRKLICACPDQACIDDVQKQAMDWAMKNMESLQNAGRNASAQQQEAMAKVDFEMKTCRDVIQGKKPEEMP